MTDPKKPKTVLLRRPPHRDPASFIDAAEAEREATETPVSEGIKTASRDNAKPLKSETAKEAKNKNVGKPFYEGKVRFTVYLPQDLYIEWKKYELEKLIAGKKVTLQETVIDHIRRLLKK